MDSTRSKMGNLRPIRPSIIIGLGGTGQRVVLEVRRRIVQEYGDLDRIPIVGFMVIDTDPEKPILPGIDDSTLKKIQLAPSEMFHATVTGTQNLKEELNSYPHLAEWVDRAILERGDVTVGAKGIRAIGRLAYFLNFVRIKKAFTAMYDRVTDQPNLRFMADTHRMQVAQGVNVFIIASVCGGTGSGMFLDLAFTIKDMLAGSEHQRIGYLALPGVFGTDMAKGAGYAALRELNHYSMDRDFEVNWENDASPRKIQPPPFDFCYLINNSNGTVNFSQKEHLFEMMAHNIFLEFSHEFGQYKASLKDNVQAVAIGTDKLDCPLNFMSLGLSTITFPRDRIMNACSHRLAKSAVSRWLSQKDNSQRMDEYIDHFLEYNRLYVDTDSSKKNQLKDELLKADGGKNFYSRIDEEMAGAYRGVQTQDQKRFDVYLEKRAEDFEKKFYEGDRDPQRWGEFFRGIYKNRQEKKKTAEQILTDTISGMLSNEKEGLFYAREFVGQLESRFTIYRDYFRTKFDELSKSESKFMKAWTGEIENLKALRDKFVFDKKKVLLEQVDNITNSRSGKLTVYFKRKIDKKILEMAILFAGELSDYCRYLLREMDLFNEKLARIKKNLEDNENTLTRDSSGVDAYSLVLYDPSDVDFYYDEFVKARDVQMERDTVAIIGERALSELGGISLFDLRKDTLPDHSIRDALVKVSRPVFEDLKDVTVARKFFEKYPTETEQMMHLKNVFSSSEVFLRFKTIPDFTVRPNSKVSLIGVYEGKQPSLPEFVNLLPMLERSCKDANQLRGIQPIRQKDEILFTTEEGAFPLRRITEIDDYERYYDKMSTGNQNPLHLRKYDRDFLVEINQPTEVEQNKARMSVYMGIALGVIKPDVDDDSYMTYTYRDPSTGFVENKPMGRRNQEESMIDNLLHRFNKGLREIIYEDIHRRLSNLSGSMADKEKTWRAINAFRTDYFSRRDKETLERKQIPELFKSIIEEYRLYDPGFLDKTGSG